MAKRHTLATRAFGAEPGIPDVTGLAAWITDHRGRQADIMTYRLDQSLAPQVSAEIGIPCAGGTFYGDRLRQCITGIDDKTAVGELHIDTSEIIEDAAGIVVQKKGAWCALPAPHALGIVDGYYHDKGEWNAAICEAYRIIMRDMRDTGVAGHVLIADQLDDAELLSLAGLKAFFFTPGCKDLAALLEHQKQVTVGKDQLERVFELMNEYEVRKIYILDPDPFSIRLALSHLDPDQIAAGGYCTADSPEYWKNLVASAVYTA